MTQNIKAELGRYEKLIMDNEVVSKMQISGEIKKAVLNEVISKCNECKSRLLNYVQELPIPGVQLNTETNTETNTEKPVVSKNTEEITDPSPITQPENTYQIWKNELIQNVYGIYDHNLNYITTKEILKEIYKYMTSVYGVCWEQDLKEWKENFGYTPKTLEIIFSNTQYKSIFDSVLEDKYNQACTTHPEKYTFLEIIHPLVDKLNDKSPGGSATSRKIYARMEQRYAVNWDKLLKKHFPNNSFAKKSDLFNINHKLFEQFRITVHEMMQEC